MKNFLPIFIAVILTSSSFAQQPVMTMPRVNHHSGDAGNSIANLLLLYDNDGGVSGINSIPSFQCNDDILPSVVIENYGSNNLTSATIQYFIDGGNPAYIDWEGSLQPFFTDTIELPELNVVPGTHTLAIQVIEANGELDINGLNNNSIQFSIVGASVPTPYSEKFEAPQLPEGYFVQNIDGGSSWIVTDATGFDSQRCMLMPFYTNDVEGDEDDLFMKNVDLSDVSESQLSFDVAYAYYSKFYFDELKVSASADCGANWDVIYDKVKDDLATAPYTDLPFVPAADQWRKEVVDMNSYTGFGDVLIRFEAISGHGNNLYIDNINIDQNTGVDDPGKISSLHIYPNPADKYVDVALPQNLTTNAEISVVNAIGEKLLQLNNLSGNVIAISSEEIPDGHYFIFVSDGKSAPVVSPLTIVH